MSQRDTSIEPVSCCAWELNVDYALAEGAWLKQKLTWLSAITHVVPEQNRFSSLFLTFDFCMLSVFGVYLGYEERKSNHAQHEWFSLPYLQADWKHQYSCNFLVQITFFLCSTSSAQKKSGSLNAFSFFYSNFLPELLVLGERVNTSCYCGLTSLRRA